ncbi:MAG: hypothetical protein P4L90_03695 [Rhodopila sp.]|nr:hypothetical protein [Rhodopila sp.]
MDRDTFSGLPPFTQALQRTLQAAKDSAHAADLLFLEAWEVHRPQDLGLTLRARQIRRANPQLAAEIEAELSDRFSKVPNLVRINTRVRQ